MDAPGQAHPRPSVGDRRGLTATGAVALALLAGLVGGAVDVLTGSGLREVFAGYSDRSAVLAALDASPSSYAWRVFVIGPDAPAYVASAWVQFQVSPP